MNIDVKAYSYSSMLAYISGNKTNFVDCDMAKASAGVWAAEQIKADVYAFYESEEKKCMLWILTIYCCIHIRS